MKPKNSPSMLSYAYDIQAEAAKVGFTWDDPHGAMLKVREEMAELEEAFAANDKDEMKKEAGDLLYSVVNFLRLAGISPEDALNSTATKFVRRFNGMQDDMAAAGIDFQSSSLEQKLEYWNQQKSKDPERSPKTATG